MKLESWHGCMDTEMWVEMQVTYFYSCKGFLVGVGIAYCCNNWITKWTLNLPYLRLHRSSIWVSRAVVVFGSL